MELLAFFQDEDGNEIDFVTGQKYPAGTCTQYPVMGGKGYVYVHPACDLELIPSQAQ